MFVRDNRFKNMGRRQRELLSFIMESNELVEIPNGFHSVAVSLEGKGLLKLTVINGDTYGVYVPQQTQTEKLK